MAVTWGTTSTYPHPSKLEEAPDFVGAVGVMADGSLSIDTITTKTRIKLTWEGITSTQANALYAQALTYTSATMNMTNAGGGSYGNVIPIPGSARYSPSGGAGSIVYDFSVEVRTT